MRLLFFTNVFPNPLQPTKGVFNLGLVRALVELGHDVEVVSPVAWTDRLRAPRARRQQLQNHRGVWADIPVQYPVYFYTPGTFRAAYGWFMWRGVRHAVRAALDRLQPDAVVAYWTHPDGRCGVQAARLANIPAILITGGSDVLLLATNRARRRVIQRVLHDASAVATVSEDLRQQLLASGLSGRKVSVVRRGIDTTSFCPGSRPEARRRLRLADDRPILLWVGRLEPVKGLPVLLDALQRLKQQGARLSPCCWSARAPSRPSWQPTPSAADWPIASAGSAPLRTRISRTCIGQPI